MAAISAYATRTVARLLARKRGLTDRRARFLHVALHERARVQVMNQARSSRTAREARTPPRRRTGRIGENLAFPSVTRPAASRSPSSFRSSVDSQRDRAYLGHDLSSIGYSNDFPAPHLAQIVTEPILEILWSRPSSIQGSPGSYLDQDASPETCPAMTSAVPASRTRAAFSAAKRPSGLCPRTPRRVSDIWITAWLCAVSDSLMVESASARFYGWVGFCTVASGWEHQAALASRQDREQRMEMARPERHVVPVGGDEWRGRGRPLFTEQIVLGPPRVQIEGPRCRPGEEEGSSRRWSRNKTSGGTYSFRLARRHELLVRSTEAETSRERMSGSDGEYLLGPPPKGGPLSRLGGGAPTPTAKGFASRSITGAEGASCRGCTAGGRAAAAGAVHRWYQFVERGGLPGTNRPGSRSGPASLGGASGV